MNDDGDDDNDDGDDGGGGGDDVDGVHGSLTSMVVDLTESVEDKKEGAREKERKREREKYVRTNAPAVVNTSACVIRQRVYIYNYTYIHNIVDPSLEPSPHRRQNKESAHSFSCSNKFGLYTGSWKKSRGAATTNKHQQHTSINYRQPPASNTRWIECYYINTAWKRRQSRRSNKSAEG